MIATFRIIFGGRMNILIIVKVKILVLIKWLDRSSPPLPNCVDYLLKLKKLTCFKHAIQIRFIHMSFWCMFLEATTNHI
jgi:hypothetical protein